MKSKIPGILILIGAIFLFLQYSAYRAELENELMFAKLNGMRQSNIKTKYYVGLPPLQSFPDLMVYLGEIFGLYFFMIFGLILVFIGVRSGFSNKWQRIDKFNGRNINSVIKFYGSPTQKITLANGEIVLLYHELNEVESRRFKKRGLINQELVNLSSNENTLDIYDYYIFLSDSFGVIKVCKKFLFEGEFSDANDIDNWEEFMQ